MSGVELTSPVSEVPEGHEPALCGVAAISREMFGDDSDANVRRCRYLISHHNLPVVKRGRLHLALPSKLRAYKRGDL